MKEKPPLARITKVVVDKKAFYALLLAVLIPNAILSKPMEMIQHRVQLLTALAPFLPAAPASAWVRAREARPVCEIGYTYSEVLDVEKARLAAEAAEEGRGSAVSRVSWAVRKVER